MSQENWTRPQENNKEGEDRKKRVNTNSRREIYRIIRNQHQATPQLQTPIQQIGLVCVLYFHSLDFLTRRYGNFICCWVRIFLLLWLELLALLLKLLFRLIFPALRSSRLWKLLNKPVMFLVVFLLESFSFLLLPVLRRM